MVRCRARKVLDDDAMHSSSRLRRSATCAAWLATVFTLSLLSTSSASAQSSADASPPAATSSDALVHVTCASTSAERTYCAGDVSAGVVLIKSSGPGECLLGRTWGYDQKGVWVTDRCSGEFAFNGLTQQTAPDSTPAPQPPREPTPRLETWGEFDPGDGFLVARTSVGELAISGYGLVRFVDQTPGSQTFIDH
jgi:hypothetical protein